MERIMSSKGPRNKKQKDVRRHNKHFTSKSDQIKFEKIMNQAYDAVTSIEAKKAEEELKNLSKHDLKWWWRRRARWQKWCRTSSTSNASSAEVANAKSVASGGYRKRLLDVITTECSSAVLEGAEVKRQDSGQKTVGRGPSSADRVARHAVDLDADIERSAAAIQNLAQSSDITQSLSDIQMAQDDYNINVKDTHRADKKRKSQKKKSKEKGAAKKKLKFFEKNVQDVNIDVVKCDVSMSKFCFTLLDTMGYIQEVTITKDAVSCTGPSCSGFCSHSPWCLHKIFHFSKEEDFIFKKHFNNSEWGQIIKAFPEQMQNSFPYERLCSKTRFKTEVKGISEMAYYTEPCGDCLFKNKIITFKLCYSLKYEPCSELQSNTISTLENIQERDLTRDPMSVIRRSTMERIMSNKGPRNKKQNHVQRHNKHFTSKSDQIKFEKIMNRAYDAVTSIEAKKAEEELEKLIKTRSMANAKSVASGGYRKWLLDVITTECSSAVLEGGETARQWTKTVRRGPSSADRVARHAVDLDADIERSAAAIQNLAQSSDITQSLSDIEMAQDDYNINVKATHRADKKRKSQKKKNKEKGAAKKKLKFFEKNVQDVNIDVVKCDVSMSKFCFTLLDTMGYIQEVTITKDVVSCTGLSCMRLPKCKERFFVNVRQSQKDANCATCKHLLQSGDVQVSTEGPYRTIMRHWISRTLYFCPRLGCISKHPQNSFIQTYCSGATKLEFDKHLSPAQQVLH
ncbi:hypothetical protein pdam_00023458 [Pocillopora damicornis]|uniref:Uncharacterized protein n=1 Tax=Pocillopora damicornis TaxID=46731 RepID=A0A3M6TWX6_POCDA|nr:hypothetical protein pdam_00023458 [Pocillopora damicornis]